MKMYIRGRIILSLYALFLAASLTGCISLHRNPPLDQVGKPDAYTFNNVLREEGELGENLVVLTLSGGGARAGALSYGVMKKMEEVKLPDGRSLLDEVKIISSVSGGSFASAYYRLHGKEKFLADYKKSVLYRKLNSQLVYNLIRFKNWIPIAISGDVGKSELSQQLYDKYFFNDKTFKDIPRNWPFVMINATDMSRGNGFAFIQENFDRLCSDLNGIKISRAVVASSAFPGPFTPLTFQNYPKTSCGYQLPDWVETVAASHPEVDPEKYVWAHNIKAYADAHARPYIHVFDGGISDNLGVRPVLDEFRMGSWDVLDEEKRFKSKRVVIIVVNAKPADLTEADKKPKIPKLMSVLVNAATKPMSNYTVKTAQEFNMRMNETKTAAHNYALVKKLCEKVYTSDAEREACENEFESPFGGIHKPPFPEFYLIHIQFDAIKDPEIKNKVSYIGTTLQLKRHEVDLLEKTGGELLVESGSFQKLLGDLGAKVDQNTTAAA